MFKPMSSSSSLRRPWMVALTALALGVAFQPSLSAQQPQTAPDSVIARRNARARVEVNSANWTDS
jgi:hypothetical protein